MKLLPKGGFVALLRTLAVVAPAAVLAAAPVVAQAPPGPRFGGTLISVLPDEPPTLAHWVQQSFLIRMVTPQIVEGLLRHDPDLTPRPGLAVSWEPSSDGKSWTFKLRQGVKFHDGKPFTADDVVFSVNEVWLKVLPDAKNRWTAVGLKVTKIDDFTVRFDLDKPYVYTTNYLSNHYGPIIPKHLYEGADIAANPYNMKPVGTGPFRFAEYVRGSHVSMNRNPDYWGRDEKGNALPYLDRLVFRIMPDATSRLLAMSKKEVDYQNYPGFPVESAAKLKELGFSIGSEPVSGVARIQRIFINQRQGPLANLKVRQALYYALNRPDIVEKAAYGFGTVSYGPLNQNSPAYADFINRDVPRYEFNPALANQMLDEAGFKRDAAGKRFELQFIINRGLSIDGNIADLMRDYFAAVGVTLVIQKVDEATRASLVGRRQYDLTMLGGTISGPSPDSVRNYWTAALKGPGSAWDNPGGIDDPAMEALIEKGVTDFNKTTRDQTWREFQKQMVEKAYEYHLFDAMTVSAWNTDFVGLPQRTWGHYDTHDRIWWVKGRAAR